MTTPALAVIVDDTGRDGNMIKRAIKELGYQANVVEKASDGVELITSGVGTLLFVNRENKSPDGLDAVKQIKANPKSADVPVILTSFGKTAQDIVAARQAGADGYVIKPLNEKAILAQVTTAAKTALSQLMRQRHIEEDQITSIEEGVGVQQELKRKLYAEVGEKARRLVTTYPWFGGGHVELGKMLLRLNQGASAVPILRKACELEGGSAKAHYLLSNYYTEQGEIEKAIFQIKAGLSVSFDLYATQKLGELQMRKGDYNGAIVTFNKVVDAMGGRGVEEQKDRAALLSRGLNQRGSSYQEKGAKEGNKNLLQRAATDFSASAKADPNFIAAKYNLMVTYKRLGETDKALKVLEEIQASEPTDMDGWLDLAEAYYHDHDKAKAFFALEKAAVNAVNDLEALKKVIDRMVQYGAVNKAEVILRFTQKKVPKDVYFCNKLGIVYRRLGKKGQAIEQYRAGIALAPEDGPLHFSLGRILLESERVEEGRRELQAALKLDPEMEEARLLLEGSAVG